MLKTCSLAYLHRQRAKTTARIRYWPQVESDSPAFGVYIYKAGMTYTSLLRPKHSPNFGKKRCKAATIIETPPILGVA